MLLQQCVRTQNGSSHDRGASVWSPGPQTAHFLKRISSQNKPSNCCYNLNFMYKGWGLPFYNTEQAELPSRGRLFFFKCIFWPLFLIFLWHLCPFLIQFQWTMKSYTFISYWQFPATKISLFLCSVPHIPHLFLAAETIEQCPFSPQPVHLQPNNVDYFTFCWHRGLGWLAVPSTAGCAASTVSAEDFLFLQSFGHFVPSCKISEELFVPFSPFHFFPSPWALNSVFHKSPCANIPSKSYFLMTLMCSAEL